ncbi:MAG: hypothetical protein IKU38_09500 [Clostridia bacterium]|nr:hypothetical protein [Clostridia bacterium]
MSSLLDSFIRPSAIKTNRDTDLIKLLACIFMFVDHAGKMLFPQIAEMRLIGRLAFPMFAYGIAVGTVYTRDPMKYLTRIALLALISQPLYALALAHTNSAMFSVSYTENPLGAIHAFYVNSWQKPSILLSLFLGLCILTALRHRRYVLAVFVYIVCMRFSGNLDYGLGGIRLMILFYILSSYPIAALVLISAYVIAWSAGSGYTFFGHSFGMRIFALPAAIFCCLPMKRRLHLPRWFIYAFYPAHLIALIYLCRRF